MDNNILIMQAARFGDLLQTSRLILSLEKRAKAHLLIDKSLGQLARIIYPNAIIHAMTFHGSPDFHALRENMAVFENLRAQNFTEIYNCNFSPLTADICRLFPEERVYGYRPARDSDGGIERSFWTRLTFRLNASRPSSPLNLVDFWGWFAKNPIAAEDVNPLPKSRGGGIGLVLSGREARRSLPPEIQAAILRVVFARKDSPGIKLLGSASEKPLARKLLKSLPPKIAAKTIDLSGHTDLAQLAAEVSQLDLLITPDTGIMHLGASLGVPVLAFFLSSALCHETGPYGKGHMIWQAAPDCAPCLERAPCKENLRCLKFFTSENFGRLLAASFEGKVVEPPKGLQLWQTDFDSLGLCMRLLAGEDLFARQRAAERYLVASSLGLEKIDAQRPATKDLDIFTEELFPASEWMLPPWRYC